MSVGGVVVCGWRDTQISPTIRSVGVVSGWLGVVGELPMHCMWVERDTLITSWQDKTASVWIK